MAHDQRNIKMSLMWKLIYVHAHGGESSGKDCQEGRNRQSLSNVAIAAPCSAAIRMVCFRLPARWWWHRLERCPKTSALRIRGSRLSPGLSTLSTTSRCGKLSQCLTAWLPSMPVTAKKSSTALGASELKALNGNADARFFWRSDHQWSMDPTRFWG